MGRRKSNLSYDHYDDSHLYFKDTIIKRDQLLSITNLPSRIARIKDMDPSEVDAAWEKAFSNTTRKLYFDV